MAIQTLLTIGYEGSSLEDFLRTLRTLKVDTVVDVRELPLSRKKGFSKSPLSDALAKKGIGYRHERTLGCPPAIRARLREDGDYKVYFRDFNKYLAGQIEFIEQLVSELDGNVALLCYERDPDMCHRRSIAEQIRDLFALKPRHVAVPA